MGIGLIRLLFALSIVFTHAGKIFGFNFVDPVVAVESFYIISGFYMALILTEKYHKVRSFLTNRALRLYPIYFIILILTLLLGAKGPVGEFIANFSRLNPLTFIILIFTNLFIFGQDIMMFLGITGQGIFHFTANFKTAPLPANIFLLVPQAWTLGLELLFYLVAPLLVKYKSWQLFIFSGLSLWLRWYLSAHGLADDPWNYRFFPSELTFFIFGILAYRIYAVVRTKQISRWFTSGSVILLIVAITTFQYISVPYSVKQWSYYFLLTLLLPFAFLHSKSNSFDRKIGDLSYPIYISHVFVIEAIVVWNPWLDSYLTMYHQNMYPIFIAFAAMVFSLLLMQFVQNPIERIRRHLLQTQYIGK